MSGVNEVSASNSEQLRGEMRSKKRHDTCHIEQQLQNNTREGTSKQVVKEGKGKELKGQGKVVVRRSR